MTTLLLASASPARAALLRTAGIDPIIRPADVDEPALLAQAAQERDAALSAAEAVDLLARAKAERIGPVADLVLGCDSLLEFDGAVWGKPESPQDAAQRWHRMRGHTGVLHTGHWLIRGDRATGAVVSTTVHFAAISDAEIDAYIATGEPLAVAGAFTVDGLGGAFVSRLEGDYHAVVGLSLASLRTMAAELGVGWTDLWQRSRD